jgi:DnaJ-class molecular chaperone
VITKAKCKKCGGTGKRKKGKVCGRCGGKGVVELPPKGAMDLIDG